MERPDPAEQVYESEIGNHNPIRTRKIN